MSDRVVISARTSVAPDREFAIDIRARATWPR